MNSNKEKARKVLLLALNVISPQRLLKSIDCEMSVLRQRFKLIKMHSVLGIKPLSHDKVPLNGSINDWILKF